MERHPAWYGSVMGTGALALALSVQSVTWGADWLRWGSQVFLVVASVLAVVLLPAYAARLRSRAELDAELADPAHGAMLATMPAGLLVLATAWGRVGWQPAGLWVDGALLVAGTIIAIALGLAWSVAMLRATNGLEGVNGGWLIPPVMNLRAGTGDNMAAALGVGAEAGDVVVSIGTSGTVTTLAAVHLGLRRYDRRKVDGLSLPFEVIQSVSRMLRGLDDAGRAAHPCIGLDRADLVVAGCAILDAVHRCWPVERLQVADRGLREGILNALMGQSLGLALHRAEAFA